MDVSPMWSVEALPGVTLAEIPNGVVVTVPDILSYEGEKIKLILADKNGKYTPGELVIEVTT